MSPLLRWLTLSSVDAVGRVFLQVLGTVLFARLLAPESFGLAALTIVYVGLLSIIVSALFEEALVQRKRIRKAHFASALGGVLMLATGLYTLLLGGIYWVPDAATEFSAVASLASVFALILFIEGPLSIYTALARRLRRFSEIALANLIGLAIGTAAGLALALSGAGVWSLLAVPFVSRLVNLLILISRSPVTVWPSRRPKPAGELFSFGRWNLGTRWVASLSQTVIQTLVTRFFGLDGNGYLNMAMRIVEPLRGMTMSISHNISMSFFSRLQADPKRLRETVAQTIADTSIVLQPIYIGLALTAPLIIEVIAGPQWLAAGPVASILALAIAIESVSGFLHTSQLAKGRSELGFAFSCCDLAVTAIALTLLAPIGLVAISFARLISWSFDSVMTFTVSQRMYGISAASVLLPLLRTTLCTGLMAIAVLMVYSVTQGLIPVLQLALVIGGGAAAYGITVVVFRRQALRSVISRLRKQPVTSNEVVNEAYK